MQIDRCALHGNSVAVVCLHLCASVMEESSQESLAGGLVIEANAVQVVLLGGKPGPMEAPALDCRTTWRLLAIDFLLELGLKMY